jgi:hypothetical protein
VNSLIQHARLVEEPPHSFQIFGRQGIQSAAEEPELLRRHLEVPFLGNQPTGCLKGVVQHELAKLLSPQPRGRQRLLVRLDADAEARFPQARVSVA